MRSHGGVRTARVDIVPVRDPQVVPPTGLCVHSAPTVDHRHTICADIDGRDSLLTYVAVGTVELAVNRVITASPAHPTGIYNPLGMILTFPLVVLIAYCAAWLRRRAPIVLGSMMVSPVTLMTFSSSEAAPAWHRTAYFVVGPAAALIRSVWHSRPPIQS